MLTPADTFRYCPKCGGAGPTPGGENPFQCQSCKFTYFFNPTVAVAGYLFDSMGQILAIRRAKEPSKGKLAIPGGFVDTGESAEDGLQREVREEVGVSIDEIRYLGSFINQYPYQSIVYPVLDILFTARVVDPANAKPLDAVAAIEWRTPSTVQSEEWAFPSLRGGVDLLNRVRVS